MENGIDNSNVRRAIRVQQAPLFCALWTNDCTARIADVCIRGGWHDTRHAKGADRGDQQLQQVCSRPGTEAGQRIWTGARKADSIDGDWIYKDIGSKHGRRIPQSHEHSWRANQEARSRFLGRVSAKVHKEVHLGRQGRTSRSVEIRGQVGADRNSVQKRVRGEPNIVVGRAAA